MFYNKWPFYNKWLVFATKIIIRFLSRVAKWSHFRDLSFLFSPCYWYLKSMALFAKIDSNSSREMSQAGENLGLMGNFPTYQTRTNVGQSVWQTYGASPTNIRQRRSAAIWTGRPNQQIQRFTRTIRFVHWKVMKLLKNLYPFKKCCRGSNALDDLSECHDGFELISPTFNFVPIPGWGRFPNLGKHSSIENTTHCGQLCFDTAGCEYYEYSPKEKKVQLEEKICQERNHAILFIL